MCIRDSVWVLHAVQRQQQALGRGGPVQRVFTDERLRRQFSDDALMAQAGTLQIQLATPEARDRHLMGLCGRQNASGALILAAVEQPDLTGFFGAIVQRGLHGMKAANQ